MMTGVSDGVVLVCMRSRLMVVMEVGVAFTDCEFCSDAVVEADGVAVLSWFAAAGAIGVFGLIAVAGEAVEEDDAGFLFCGLGGSHD